jgi:hypothetical protein
LAWGRAQGFSISEETNFCGRKKGVFYNTKEHVSTFERKKYLQLEEEFFTVGRNVFYDRKKGVLSN